MDLLSQETTAASGGAAEARFFDLPLGNAVTTAVEALVWTTAGARKQALQRRHKLRQFVLRAFDDDVDDSWQQVWGIRAVNWRSVGETNRHGGLAFAGGRTRRNMARRGSMATDAKPRRHDGGEKKREDGKSSHDDTWFVSGGLEDAVCDALAGSGAGSESLWNRVSASSWYLKRQLRPQRALC